MIYVLHIFMLFYKIYIHKYTISLTLLQISYKHAKKKKKSYKKCNNIQNL